MNSEHRRRELAAFIRSRRERRSPAEAGLAVTGRRRTPGLRREEVATMAGVSVTWYTWLEQARDIRVSRQVLTSLVNALGLDEVETAHLFQLAGEVPPSELAAPEPELPAQYRLLLTQLEPSPAYIVNRRFDIVAWNRACQVFYGDLERLAERRRNILWLTFAEPEFRRISADWEQEAAYTVALFRAQAGDALLQPDVAELVEELEQASPHFRRLWRRKDLAPFVPERRTMFHPSLGRVDLEYVKMHAAGDDKTLVAYLVPAGSELGKRITELIGDADG
ncbi:helix-turn-helix transcriptional regulator [Allostreptomyces psammosilenae]|uniref:Transcriptional regulator with XRE-family HTH domain n=1 Tax=Allostreptomyces psammosilenae TaxID=1892865 RepID=A0A852ZUE5_9ACTN|nr:helix-turn-helix transcriptional regulator [Allostreptomyces psammosilenae]NYI04910.1 transcriptional regulator with XRE-family HTH domain [Allostreptomyces psammosilenae]